MNTPTKPRRKFLQATEAMMNAMEVADGMSAHQLRCFQFNFQQFMAEMITKAESDEQARKYPMTRHDWGKYEQRPAGASPATTQ